MNNEHNHDQNLPKTPSKVSKQLNYPLTQELLYEQAARERQAARSRNLQPQKLLFSDNLNQHSNTNDSVNVFYLGSYSHPSADTGQHNNEIQHQVKDCPDLKNNQL